jgi:SRSO17 transposase
MAKAKRAKFTKYQATGATTTHKHVRYVTKTDGRLKMSTSFVTIKQGQQSTDLKASTSSFSDDELLQRVDEILLNAEGLDPAYVEHLAEINVEPAQHPHGPAVRYTLSINTNS